MPNPNERLTRLRQTLTSKLSLEELRDLCVDIGIDFDNLPGEGKSSKIRELIAYCQRRGQLNNLIQGISATWPDEDWVKSVMQDFPEAIPTSTSSDSASPPMPTLSSLTGSQLQQFQSSLLSAFPTRSSLDQMLLFQLNQNLNVIAGNDNMQDTVFALIRWAQSNGRLVELINGARAANSGNADLKAFADQVLPG